MVAPPHIVGGEESPSSTGQRTPLTAGPPTRSLIGSGRIRATETSSSHLGVGDVKRGNLYAV